MIDSNGYPGAMGEDGTFDGGDTAAIMGTIAALSPKSPLPKYPWDYDKNVPLRHPNTAKWYGQPDRFSRDQLVPLLCALALHKGNPGMLFASHAKRLLLFAWNTRKNGAINVPKKLPDFTGPSIWALWLRVYKPKFAVLLLSVLDVELLISAIHWRWFRKDRVCRNHMLELLTARKTLPTLTSMLADKLTNWPDLIKRWHEHCIATKEYNTASLFEQAQHGP